MYFPLAPPDLNPKPQIPYPKPSTLGTRMYFPRGAADVEIQRRELPEDVGNERGEPVVEDRQVRIGAMPGVSGDEIPSVGPEQV